MDGKQTGAVKPEGKPVPGFVPAKGPDVKKQKLKPGKPSHQKAARLIHKGHQYRPCRKQHGEGGHTPKARAGYVPSVLL